MIPKDKHGVKVNINDILLNSEGFYRVVNISTGYVEIEEIDFTENEDIIPISDSYYIPINRTKYYEKI